MCFAELERAEETWTSFLERFPELSNSVENVEALGRLVKVLFSNIDIFIFQSVTDF